MYGINKSSAAHCQTEIPINIHIAHIQSIYSIPYKLHSIEGEEEIIINLEKCKVFTILRHSFPTRTKASPQLSFISSIAEFFVYIKKPSTPQSLFHRYPFSLWLLYVVVVVGRKSLESLRATSLISHMGATTTNTSSQHGMNIPSFRDEQGRWWCAVKQAELSFPFRTFVCAKVIHISNTVGSSSLLNHHSRATYSRPTRSDKWASIQSA